MSQTHLVRRGGTLQDKDKLRAIRMRLGMRCTEAAALIGCHPRSLEYLENGRRGASEVMLNRIARAYGIDVSEITREASGAAA